MSSPTDEELGGPCYPYWLDAPLVAYGDPLALDWTADLKLQCNVCHFRAAFPRLHTFSAPSISLFMARQLKVVAMAARLKPAIGKQDFRLASLGPRCVPVARALPWSLSPSPFRANFMMKG